MPNVPDYSSYIETKKVSVAQTVNTNTSAIKGRAPNRYDGYFPLYKGIKLPKNALISNKFIKDIIIFSPLNIPGILVWLDFNDPTTVTLSSGNITRINTKVPNSSIYFTNGGTVAQSSVEGGNTALFGGNNYMISSTTFSFVTANTTIFVVFRKTGSAPQSGGYMIAQGADDFSLRFNGDSFGTVTGPYDWHDSSGVSTAVVNGTPNITSNPSVLNTTSIVYAPISKTNNANLRLSGGFNGDRYYVGHICEVIMYSKFPTAMERRQLEGYLSWKWGIISVLPASHPFKVTGPPSF